MLNIKSSTLSPFTHQIKSTGQKLFKVPLIRRCKQNGTPRDYTLCHLESGQVTRVNNKNIISLKPKGNK